MLAGLPLFFAEIDLSNPRQILIGVVLLAVLLAIAFANRPSTQHPETNSRPGTNSLTLLGFGAAYPFSIRGSVGGFTIADVENLVAEWAQLRHGPNARPCLSPWVAAAMAPFQHPPYLNLPGFIIQGTICLHGEDAISLLRGLGTHVASNIRETQIHVVHVGPSGVPQQFIIAVPAAPRRDCLSPPPAGIFDVPDHC